MITPIYCSLCGGAGTHKNIQCLQCRGEGTVVWTGKYGLYWGMAIDTLHILQRKITSTIRNTIDFLLLIFGIFGILLLFFNIDFNSLSFEKLEQLWYAKNFTMLVFWISIVSDSYLFFRFMRRVESIYKMPKDVFAPQMPNTKPPQWEEIKKLPISKHIDISKYYTEEAITALEKSYELSKKYSHAKVVPIHLFISLLSYTEIINIFVRLGVSFKSLRSKLSHVLETYYSPIIDTITYSQEFHLAQFSAFEHGYITKKKKVDLSDLLIGACSSSEILSEILYDLEIDLEKIQNVSMWSTFGKNLKQRVHKMRSVGSRRPKSGMNRSMTAVATPFLNSFSEDLTLQARSGILDPCIGRGKEIEEVFEILSGGTRRNVVLVGAPGIGKRTIIYGVAYLMISEEVPLFLQDKRLVNLSVARLVSGVSASEAEERILRIMDEIIKSQNIVLCIHEVSHLIGISSGSSGSIDLAGVLAEALEQKQVMLISTSSSEDYSKYLENNNTLGGVLEKIDIKEVEGNEAILILEAKSGPIEYKYSTFFTYDAIVKTMELSAKYIHDRYLPEKAIEILEETASRVFNTKGKDVLVTHNDVAQTVSLKTDIPLTQITQDESEKLLKLEEKIHERMIDQNEAVSMASAAVRRARAEIRDTKRPIVNLLFLGPTGVGKTQLAKTLSRVYFGSESKMIRLDMSEYQEKSSINRLIGFGDGGGDASGGYLTEQVRHHPFALLLLDEIEKAHPDILNVFLQVMDDGRLTDARGRLVDFTNIIIICTSNACTTTIQKRITQGKTPQQIKDEIISGELIEYFRPEFINRFDGVVVFKPLSREDVRQITLLLLDGVAQELEKKGIMLRATDGAVDWLANLGFDPLFGARPLRRVVQEKVDDVIANYILSKKVDRRDTIIIDVGGRIDIVKSKKY